jgi:hypothetical protein
MIVIMEPALEGEEMSNKKMLSSIKSLKYARLMKSAKCVDFPA